MVVRLRWLLAIAVAVGGLWGVSAKVAMGLSADDIALMPAMIAFSVMGILLVLKVPENTVSWLVFGVGATASILGLVEAYGGVEIAEFVAGMFIFGVLIPVVGVMLPLVFPTGAAIGRGWSWVGRVCWLGVTAMFVGFVLQGLIEGNLSSDVGCEGTGSCMALWGLVVVLGCAVLSVVSFVVRWRRSREMEREQLRWLILPFIALILSLLVEFSGNDESMFALGFLGLGFFLVPVAIGIAVLKYRLYEIDRIISRTLAYVVVVGFLGAIYTAGAVWLPSVLLGEETPPLFVAGSTLAVAALFNPMRKRVQTWVDRRFNRSRYDAELVMDEFAGTLQDRTDAPEVVGGWVDVVSRTMQPSVIGVWVR